MLAKLERWEKRLCIKERNNTEGIKLVYKSGLIFYQWPLREQMIYSEALFWHLSGSMGVVSSCPKEKQKKEEGEEEKRKKKETQIATDIVRTVMSKLGWPGCISKTSQFSPLSQNMHVHAHSYIYTQSYTGIHEHTDT